MANFTFEDMADGAAPVHVEMCVSSNGLQSHWRSCHTSVQIKSSYPFSAFVSGSNHPGFPERYVNFNANDVVLVFNGNSELKALAHLFRSSADFLDYVCRQTQTENETGRTENETGRDA